MIDRSNFKGIGLILGMLAGGVAGYFIGVYPLFIALGGSIGIIIGTNIATRRR